MRRLCDTTDAGDVAGYLKFYFWDFVCLVHLAISDAPA